MDIVDVKHHHEHGGTGRIYGWHTIAVRDAMKMADPRIRCPECKGAVGLYANALNGRMPKRAEHKVANPGCSLGHNFNGEAKLASLPIEPDEEGYRNESSSLTF